MKKYKFTDIEICEIQNCIERLRKLSNLCKDHNLKLMVDAEQSYFQTSIDAFVATLQKEFNKSEGIILNTFQSYLHDSREKIETYFNWNSENRLKTGVKLVRGAYMNEENRLAFGSKEISPINGTKELTDKLYNSNLSFVINAHTLGSILCIATHNDQSIELAKNMMSEKKLSRLRSGISFAQLLGMKSTLSYKLSVENYLVQKYVPFGPFEKMIPYLSRRANEQSEMINETGMQISKIIEELQHRLGH